MHTHKYTHNLCIKSFFCSIATKIMKIIIIIKGKKKKKTPNGKTKNCEIKSFSSEKFVAIALPLFLYLSHNFTILKTGSKSGKKMKEMSARARATMVERHYSSHI